MLCKLGHASPIKWCLKENVLVGKCSTVAMLELQSIRFAGWALTEGQHRPKAGKKKKTREAGLFFLVPTSPRCFIREWVNPTFPDPVRGVYLSIVHILCSKLYVDRRNVNPVVRGTPGGAQGRSSWEGGAPKAQRAEGVLRRRRSTGRRPVRKKRPTKWVFFFWFPLRK